MVLSDNIWMELGYGRIFSYMGGHYLLQSANCRMGLHGIISRSTHHALDIFQAIFYHLGHSLGVESLVHYVDGFAESDA